MKNNQKNPSHGKQIKWLIGIDEVGRGPLAGPVGVSICVIPFEKSISNSYKIFLNKTSKKMKDFGVKFSVGKDSKKMTEKERERWFEFLHHISVSETATPINISLLYKDQSSKKIDKIGISKCIQDSIKFLLNKAKEDMNFLSDECFILLDGGLKAPSEFLYQETNIRGDEKHLVISLASVHAKVTRDLVMKKNSKKDKYAKYGFEVHKGYGTARHRQSIAEHGLSDLHRVTYCRNIHKSA